MGPEGFRNIAKNRTLEDTGAPPKEECDLIWECKAMFEEKHNVRVERGSFKGGKKGWLWCKRLCCDFLHPFEASVLALLRGLLLLDFFSLSCGSITGSATACRLVVVRPGLP